ncbi:WD repeat-containing protein 43 [Frankliniella fusca]|uniref:WD repeat-containing protein 43 n=1 Tax=Frankliniella fusca TaxID=407009 RepID=A0AAE1LJY7_9NEOP|nr:WD repeat-containing protein 43 [Frankliniella fusca]
MLARSLLRSVGLLGSAQLPESRHFLAEQCFSRSGLAPKFPHSTSSKPYLKPLEVVVVNDVSSPAPYTLTKEQEMAITKGDPVKDAKLCELLLKLYIKKEQGENLPKFVRLEDLEVMLDMGQSQLSKMLRYLHSREAAKKRNTELKQASSNELALIREDRAKALSEMENPWLYYAVHCNSIFPRFYKRTINRFYDACAGMAVQEGQKVIIDCSYESEMDEPRIKNTARQIISCCVINRGDRRPFSLHLCNLNKDSRLMYYLRRIDPGFEIDAPIGLHSNSYLNIFDREKLLYLTPHAQNTVEYNPDDIYILGGLVDKNLEPLSNKKALKEKIRFASLPLDKYLKWKLGSKNLCINHVFKTLLTVKNTGDWKKAIEESVPKRKVWGGEREEIISQPIRRTHGGDSIATATHDGIMASSSNFSFSLDSQYYAASGADGKLRIWDTQKNVLLQEFTPNLHLTSPCSCLKWLCTSSDPDTGTPSKKKRRKSRDVGAEIIALGTSSGRILLYSVASAGVEAVLDGGHRNAPVTGLSWFPGTSLYSCGDSTITEWDISGKKVKSKWKTGDKVGCVLVSPDSKYILSAARSIKLWDCASHELLKTYTGHVSPVASLTFLSKTAPNGDLYFFSTAKGDRYVNVWSLNKKNSEKSALVAMVLESEPTGTVSLYSEQGNGTVSLAAVTESGIVQMFNHQLNGLCRKPLKPFLSVQMATDSARGKESVEPIPIVSAVFVFKNELRIVYGTGTYLAFENVVLNCSEKIQVLVRRDPRRAVLESSADQTLVKVPDSQKAIYLQPTSSNAVVSGTKRSHSRKTEVPMEERLENLSLSMARTDERSSGLPRPDNLAQLMLQALISKDKPMLQTVLLRREEDVIRNTVQRLPLQVIEPLLKELTTLLHAKTATAQIGARWLRIVLSTHAAHLMANPSLVELLAPVIGLVEFRLSLLPSLTRLSGRLDLLSSQLDGATGSDENTTPLDMQPGLLTYQDADTSDEEGADDAGGLGSESDDHWEELSDSDSNDNDDEEENDGDEDNDVDMSE